MMTKGSRKKKKMKRIKKKCRPIILGLGEAKECHGFNWLDLMLVTELVVTFIF